jgi:CHAT domain-containing protein/Tfp pilus assembly protein PilF
MGNRRLKRWRKWLKRMLALLLGVILFSEAGVVLAQDARSVENEAIVAQSDTEAEDLEELVERSGELSSDTYVFEDADNLTQADVDKIYNLLQSAGELENQQTRLGSQQALEKYKELIVLGQRLENQTIEATGYYLAGTVLFDLGDLEQALEAVETSFAYFAGNGQLNFAYFTGNDQLNFARGLGLIRAISLLGAIHSRLRNYEKAMGFYRFFLKVWEDLPLHTENEDAEPGLTKAILQGQATAALYGLGVAYLETGYPQEALIQFEQALLSGREFNHRQLEGHTLHQLGITYSRTGSAQEALNAYSQALSIFEEVNSPRDQLNVLNSMGLLYNNFGSYDDALRLYQQALPLAEQAGTPQQQGIIFNNIGLAYDNKEDFEQALYYYQNALPLRRAAQDRLGEITTINNIGAVFLRQGEWEQALPYLENALKGVEELNAPSKKAIALGNVGAAYHGLSRLQDALRYYQQSLALSQDIGDPYQQIRALNNLSWIYKNQGEIQIALKYVEDAIKVIENLRNQINTDDLRLSYFGTQQSSYVLNIDLLMELGREDEAFNTSEKSRARTLIELLAESNIDPSQATEDPELKALHERKQELEVQLSARENLIQTAQTDEIREQHQQEYQQLERELKDNVEPQIKQKDPAYAAIRYPTPLTLDQIQRDVLDDETVLLQYAIGEQQSYLWVVPHQGEMTTYTLPGRKVIEPAAKQFLSEVERSGIRPGSEPEEAKFTGDQLYALIFQDANTQQSIMPLLQGKKRLLIAADGILHTIPFSALPLPNTERYTPLITQYEIVNTPSASTIAIVRQQFKDRQPAAKTIALLADPVFRVNETRVTQQSATEEDICGTAADRASIANFLINTPESSANSNLPIEVASTLRSFNLSHLRRLPCTRLEADSILPLVPDPNQKAAVFDFNANYDWMTQANSQLDQYRIIHLATHGFANEEKPELSMLVLSQVDSQGNTQNGMLRLRDIFNLKLNADMVVLSACQTGQGETVRGEGLIGITRGFMYAGAKRVVNSLWYVDDAKTAELMVRFYHGILKENLSPTAALQKAQIQMWETYKKPDLWAAFTIQGEWRIQN